MKQMVLVLANIAPTPVHNHVELDASATNFERAARSRRSRRVGYD
jgi:hypothetical protein